MKIGIKTLLILLSLLAVFSPVTFLQATTQVPQEMVNLGIGGPLEDELARLQREIDAINAQRNEPQKQLNANNYQIAGYNSQLSNLYGEANLIQKEIDKINLEIQETELNIKMLDEEIVQNKEDVKANEIHVQGLEIESNKRLKDSYKKFRIYGNNDSNTNLVFFSSINTYFKDSQYKEIMQSDTNTLLTDLAIAKAELEEKKTELDQNLAEVQNDRELVLIKARDMDKKKQEVESKMAIYFQEVGRLQATNNATNQTIAVFSREQQQKWAEAERLKQQILNSFSSIPSGQYVVKGTIIGRQGSTGWSTGAHLHFSVYDNGAVQNPCGYLKAGTMGCGSGTRLEPPLIGGITFTSGFGNRCFWWDGQNTCHFHDGIDVVGSPWNAAVYAAHDGYLAKGVDLYGALYVVICESTNCNNGIKTGYWHLSAY